jgi:hypothetical protein
MTVCQLKFLIFGFNEMSLLQRNSKKLKRVLCFTHDYKNNQMALERFIAQHRLIAETLVGVNAERMTALEIHFNEITDNYNLAYAIAVAESAEAVDGFEGKYDEITNILKAIGEKRGLDWNDNCNAWEQWEMDREGYEDEYVFTRLDEVLGL